MPKPEEDYIPPPEPSWRFFALVAVIAGVAGYVVGLTRLSAEMSFIPALIAAVSGAFAAFARDCFISILIRWIVLGVFLYYLPLEVGTALTLYPLLIGAMIGSLVSIAG